MNPPTSRRVEVRPGLALHTRTFGPAPDGTDEPPVMLVHGLSATSRQWDTVATDLAGRGHPVVAVDQRGHGQSDKPDVGYDVPTVADDLARLIDAIGWDRPVAVGHSWGGNVVVELAAGAAEQVRGIACIDGGMIDLRSRFDEWTEAAEVIAPPRSAGADYEQIEQTIRAMFAEWPESGIAGMMASFERHPDGTAGPWLTYERHMTVLHELWSHGRPRFTDVAVPTLLVPAEGQPVRWAQDKRAAVEAAAAAIPHVRVEWMVGDHDLHAQHPAAVARLLHEATHTFW